MESHRKPPIDEFEKLLTDDTLRSMSIIQAALGSGVVLFMFIVIAMYFSMESSQAGDPQLIWILTLVHFILAANMIFLSSWMYKRRLTAGAIAKSSPTGTIDAASCLDALRNAIIIRLAFLEGAAFYGLVVCIVAVMNGVMQENPIYWINLASAFVMLLHVVWLFPSRDRLIEFYKNDFRF